MVNNGESMDNIWIIDDDIWVNEITTSLFSLTGIMVSKGNYPQMAELFRLVNYYNEPRLSSIIIKQ